MRIESELLGRPTRIGAEHASDGFTLIELLVALSIIALVLAIVPSLWPGVSRASAEASAKQVLTDLRRAHALAIRTGHAVSIVLEEGNGAGYTVGSKPVALAGSSLEILDPATGEVTRGGTRTLEFFPDGSARPALLRVRSGKVAVSLVIEPMSGGVTANALR